MGNLSRVTGPYFNGIIEQIAADRILYVILSIYCSFALIYACATGIFSPDAAFQMLDVYTQISLTGYCVAFPFLLLIGMTIRIILRLPRRRWLAFRKALDARSVARILAGTALLLAMIPFRALFNLVKFSIPNPGGFAYDRLLADIDRALHFGIDPFRFLHAIGHNELLLRIVELNYNNLWFIITFGALYVIAVSPRFAAIRLRFVACFVLAWALSGTLFAILGSSAGPVYFGLVTGDTERFADLVSFVQLTRGQPGAAADFQDYLWTTQSQGHIGVGSGISAFPSVHVTIITMLALFIGELKSRAWTIAAWAYVAITCASSVYLGWHYAVDGYAAIAVAAATHFGVKKLASAKWRWRAPAVEASSVSA